MKKNKILREVFGVQEAPDAGGQFCLVIRNDDVVYGPFPTEQAAEAYAKTHYEDPDQLSHADTNADFYVCPFQAPEAGQEGGPA